MNVPRTTGHRGCLVGRGILEDTDASRDETNGSAVNTFWVRKCGKSAAFEELGLRVEKPVPIPSAAEVQ